MRRKVKNSFGNIRSDDGYRVCSRMPVWFDKKRTEETSKLLCVSVGGAETSEMKQL